MHIRRTLLALVLAALAGNVAAQQPSPSQTGALPVNANRIVGLWQIQATIGPCQGGPKMSFLALHNYHAGGTLTDTNVSPPTSRGPGLGIWKYRGYGQYKARFQIARFLPDGSFDGLTDVRTSPVLNASATAYTATAYARVLNLDGSLRVALCGGSNASRVPIH